MKRRSRLKAAKRARARKVSKKAKSKKSGKSAVRAYSRKARKAAPRGKVPRRAGRKKGRRQARVSRTKPSQSMMFEPLEQVTVSCSNCGRQFNIVKLHGLSMEGMICQRCAIGEVEFPEG